MKLQNILLSCVLTLGFTHADVQSNMTKAQLTAEFQGLSGNKEVEINSLIAKIDTVGFSTVAANTHIQKFYYKKFQEKGVEMLSFFSMVNIDKIRPLLLANPDFGAYAPFNFLVYKTLDLKTDDNTWFGQLSTDTMLDIVDEKDTNIRKEFTEMMSGWDAFVDKEIKPTKTKRFERTKGLPEKGLTKFVKKFDKPDDLEEWIEEFIGEHDGRFAKNNFIIAGFMDFKFEYDDRELDFEKYDAYWVSLLCHFEFSNSIFNRGVPEAAMFAPCSVYFYIPKGSNELHVGYASVDNWINALNFEDKKHIDYMKEIDAEVIQIFKDMGFTLL